MVIGRPFCVYREELEFHRAAQGNLFDQQRQSIHTERGTTV